LICDSHEKHSHLSEILTEPTLPVSSRVGDAGGSQRDHATRWFFEKAPMATADIPAASTGL
jgi:hypothetical protein